PTLQKFPALRCECGGDASALQLAPGGAADVGLADADAAVGRPLDPGDAGPQVLDAAQFGVLLRQQPALDAKLVGEFGVLDLQPAAFDRIADRGDQFDLVPRLDDDAPDLGDVDRVDDGI